MLTKIKTRLVIIKIQIKRFVVKIKNGSHQQNKLDINESDHNSDASLGLVVFLFNFMLIF
jgi:hypothetical protein